MDRTPICRMGWRTVDRAGVKMDASSMSSKPVTATSSGTRNPLSFKERMAPTAMVSPLATMPVNCTPSLRSLTTAS